MRVSAHSAATTAAASSVSSLSLTTNTLKGFSKIPMDDQSREVYDHLGIGSAECSDPSISHLSDDSTIRRPLQHVSNARPVLLRSYGSSISLTDLVDPITILVDPGDLLCS